MNMKTRISLNQLSLPFGQRAGGRRALALSYEDRVKAFWFLSSALLVAFVAYVYAVNATAHHVAERAALEREASNLNAELATLEFQSIAMKNDVTIEVARQYGFEEVAQPLYVAKKSDAALSFNAKRP